MFQTIWSPDSFYGTMDNYYGCQYCRINYAYQDNYMLKQAFSLLSWVDVYCDLGSPEHISRVNRTELIYGPIFALKQLMNDFNTYDSEIIEYLKYDLYANFNRLCRTINELVKKVTMTKEIHYFRNKINKAPKTLEELLREKEDWTLLLPHQSTYHMHGIDGIFNLKFVSKYGGHFEAVYDKNNKLVTDRLNIGTYNYVGPDDHEGHRVYDVNPYYRWGNTERCIGDGEIGSLRKALDNLISYSLDLNAIQRYQKYYFEMNNKLLSINDSIKLLRNKISILEGTI